MSPTLIHADVVARLLSVTALAWALPPSPSKQGQARKTSHEQPEGIVVPAQMREARMGAGQGWRSPGLREMPVAGPRLWSPAVPSRAAHYQAPERRASRFALGAR